MITELNHQKVRRRRPVLFSSDRQKKNSPFLLAFDARGNTKVSYLSPSGAPVFRRRSRGKIPWVLFLFPITLLVVFSKKTAAALRSGLWKRKLKSVHLAEQEKTSRASFAPFENVLARLKLVLSRRSRFAFPVLSGIGILLFGFAILLESSLPSVWAGDIRLPEETEVDGLLQNFLEPQNKEIRIGESKQVDVSKLSSLKLVQYRLASGDTISGIAKKFDLYLDTLISFNQIEDVRKVPIGTELKIPNQNGVIYNVQRGDSLSVISKSFNVNMNALADMNSLESATIHPGQDIFIPGARMRPLDLKKILGELFIYPTNGVFTSGFGPRNDPFTGVLRFHNGVDLAAPSGTPIYAAMAGKIAKVGFHPSYGRYIIMSHSSGYQTWYAHLQKALVGSNASVAQGEIIGEMGNTGYSTGPHLHFSVFRNGSPVDPMQFLH